MLTLYTNTSSPVGQHANTRTLVDFGVAHTSMQGCAVKYDFFGSGGFDAENDTLAATCNMLELLTFLVCLCVCVCVRVYVCMFVHVCLREQVAFSEILSAKSAGTRTGFRVVILEPYSFREIYRYLGVTMVEEVQIFQK